MINNELWLLIGGQERYGGFNPRVTSYNPITRVWRSCAPYPVSPPSSAPIIIPAPTVLFEVVVYDNRVYVFNTNPAAINEPVRMYDPIDDRWSLLYVPANGSDGSHGHSYSYGEVYPCGVSTSIPRFGILMMPRTIDNGIHSLTNIRPVVINDATPHPYPLYAARYNALPILTCDVTHLKSWCYSIPQQAPYYDDYDWSPADCRVRYITSMFDGTVIVAHVRLTCDSDGSSSNRHFIWMDLIAAPGVWHTAPSVGAIQTMFTVNLRL